MYAIILQSCKTHQTNRFTSTLPWWTSDPIRTPGCPNITDPTNTKWFRTPANSPLEVGRSSHDLHGLIMIVHHLGCINLINNGINYISTGDHRISEPSTLCQTQTPEKVPFWKEMNHLPILSFLRGDAAMLVFGGGVAKYSWWLFKTIKSHDHHHQIL